MRVVVLGAGTVGTWIADLLCQHRHSVTVVDSNPKYVKRVNDEMDVKAILGSASQSSILFQADVSGADLCLAVTGEDETNLVAASMAKAMGARRTFARVYGSIFRDRSTFDYQRHFMIDRLLSLEHLTAMELARGIRSPGSLAVENLADGKLVVQSITIPEQTPVVGKALKDLDLRSGVRVGSIRRDGKTWIAGALDEVQVGDRITLIGRRDDLRKESRAFRKKTGEKLKVVIAGAGETGCHLANSLSDRSFSVLVMEADKDRCELVANSLPHVTVVHADATRRSILEEERVGNADVFAACTGDDETNIMAGVAAREIGAERIMAIINRPDYANVVGKLGIDITVSPREVVAKQVMSYLNKGAVISRTMLAGGSIGVFELEVFEGSTATANVLAELDLPAQCLIAAVMREDFVHVPGAQDRLRPGDVVVALVEHNSVGSMLSIFGAER